MNTFYNTNLANINNKGMINYKLIIITLLGFFLMWVNYYTCIYMDIGELLFLLIYPL